MSKENLSNLLDEMLDESADALRVKAAVEAERRKEPVAPPAASSGDADDAFPEIEALLGIPDDELAKVVDRTAPDDLLIVLATSEGPLQRRILSTLNVGSIKWVKENLAHIDRVTDGERDRARAKLLKAARALLDEGVIKPPEAPEEDGAEGPPAAARDLRLLLADLTRVAKEHGVEAVAAVVEGAGEPLLEAGVRAIRGGATGEGLREALADEREALMAEYCSRLAMIEDALVAIAADDPKGA